MCTAINALVCLLFHQLLYLASVPFFTFLFLRVSVPFFFYFLYLWSIPCSKLSSCNLSPSYWCRKSLDWRQTPSDITEKDNSISVSLFLYSEENSVSYAFYVYLLVCWRFDCLCAYKMEILRRTTFPNLYQKYMLIVSLLTLQASLKLGDNNDGPFTTVAVVNAPNCLLFIFDRQWARLALSECISSEHKRGTNCFFGDISPVDNVSSTACHKTNMIHCKKHMSIHKHGKVWFLRDFRKFCVFMSVLSFLCLCVLESLGFSFPSTID